MAQTFNTIRLIDLIDTNTQSIESLYSLMSSNLIGLYDRQVYPVNDRVLWANFIERLCDRYFNRYLSFDTYYAWQLKLKFLLEQNKEKYIKIYENSLREIDPLLTFSESEHVEDNKESTGSNETDTSGGYVDNINTSVIYGKSDTTKDERKTTVKNITDDERTINAFTNNPKSQSSMSAHLTELEYIDNEQLTINKNNYTNTSKNEGDITVTTSGSDKNVGTNDGTSNSRSNGQYTGSDKGVLDRLRKGFNGNQLELLKKYEELYFDVNKEIIEDIERARLFMSVLC